MNKTFDRYITEPGQRKQLWQLFQSQQVRNCFSLNIHLESYFMQYSIVLKLQGLKEYCHSIDRSRL